jgi:hypothetical protein
LARVKPKAPSGGSLKCWNKAEDGPLRNGKMNNVAEDINMQQSFGAIREHDTDVPVALCKEAPETHRLFTGLVDATKCNCLV